LVELEPGNVCHCLHKLTGGLTTFAERWPNFYELIRN